MCVCARVMDVGIRSVPDNTSKARGYQLIGDVNFEVP